MKYSEHVLKSPPYSQTATLTRIQTWNSVWWITYSALFLYWILILDFWGLYWHDTGLTYAEDGGSWIHWYSFYLYVPLPRHFSWQSYPKRTSRGVQHVAKSRLPTMTHMLNCMTLLSFSISKHDSFHDLKIVFCSFLLMLSASHSTWAENQMHKTNKLWDELENPVDFVPWSYCSLCILTSSDLKCMNFACLQHLSKLYDIPGIPKARGNAVKHIFKDRQASVKSSTWDYWMYCN